MAFEFSLGAILRFRESVEQQREVQLRQANQQVAELRRQIEQILSAAHALTAKQARELNAGTRAAELHFNLLQHQLLLGQRARLEKEHAKAMDTQSQRRLALQKARQEREVVEALRTRQLQAYREQESRQEQQGIDDLLLLRREFLRRELGRRT